MKKKKLYILVVIILIIISGGLIIKKLQSYTQNIIVNKITDEGANILYSGKNIEKGTICMIDNNKICKLKKLMRFTRFWKITIHNDYIEFHGGGFLENSNGILKIINQQVSKEDIYKEKSKQVYPLKYYISPLNKDKNDGWYSWLET